MKRRTLLNTALAAGTVSWLGSRRGESVEAEAEGSEFKIVDTNVSLFRWPFRRLPLDETEALLKKLSALGISEAWAGTFEGVFHRDLRAANQRLADACAAHDMFVPIGSINPTLPGWEDDLKRCHEGHGMPGIRLHLNYHGYALSDGRFKKLLSRAAEMKIFLQIAVALEDVRTQPEKMRVDDVDLTSLPELLKDHADARVELLNGKLRGAILESLAETSNVYFDTARVDATDGVANLLSATSPDRVLFGTHAPFLIPEAALIRVHESGLPEPYLQCVLQKNARRIAER